MVTNANAQAFFVFVLADQSKLTPILSAVKEAAS